MTKVLKTRANGVARDDIVAAATKLFAERGFATVTLREIAMKAKVHVPAIYHHFDDKRALYLTCCVGAFSTYSRKLAALINDDLSDEENILTFMNGLCQLHLTQPILSKLVQRQVLDDDKMLLEFIGLYAINTYTDPLIKILSRVCPGGDAGRTAFSLIGLSYGASQLKGFHVATGWTAEALNKPEDLARYVLDVIIPGVDWGLVSRTKAGREKPKRAVPGR